MMTSLVLTVIGPDRPGLVSAVARHVSAAGGNWLDSRMVNMAGQFAGLAMVTVPTERVQALRDALATLEAEGLKVLVEQGLAPAIRTPATDTRLRQMELTGLDCPGIVRAVSDALTRHGIGIAELDTRFFNASFSGEAMFEMRASLDVPADTDDAALGRLADGLAETLTVDIKLGRPEAC